MQGNVANAWSSLDAAKSTEPASSLHTSCCPVKSSVSTTWSVVHGDSKYQQIQIVDFLEYLVALTTHVIPTSSWHGSQTATVIAWHYVASNGVKS